MQKETKNPSDAEASSDIYSGLPKVTFKDLASRETLKDFLVSKSCRPELIAMSSDIYNHFSGTLLLTLKEHCRQASDLATASEGDLEDLMPITFESISATLDGLLPSRSTSMKDNIMLLVNKMLVDCRDLTHAAVDCWITFMMHRFWLFFEHGVNDFDTFGVFVLECRVMPELRKKTFAKMFEEKTILLYLSSTIGKLVNDVSCNDL